MSKYYLCPPVYISEEIIFEILKRLPAKSLLRFMSVCKSWYSLIKSPNFISFHFKHQSKKQRYLLYCNSEKPGNCYVHADNENFDMHLEITCPYMFFKVGCSDGIVCYYIDNLLDTTSFVLWNSSLRKSLDLKVPHCTSSDVNENFTHWFGFDAVSNDYKFVWVGYSMTASFETRLFVVYIYSLNERTWRCADSSFVLDDVCVIMFEGVYLNGVIHWGAKRYYEDHDMPQFILTFDLADETFGLLSLPSEVFYVEPSYDYICPKDRADLITVKIGSKNCLAILHHYWTNLDLWVMDEEGIVESWRKEFDIRLDFYVDKTLNFRMNGDLVMQIGTEGVVSFDYTRMMMKHLSVEYMDYVGTYMETLLLL